ncbi:MAG TPA: cytochrome c [Polyangiaceae bacterium]|jgi:cytochrome c oxidase cbb3-type subunit 3
MRATPRFRAFPLHRLALWGALSGLSALGCERPPSADKLPEWTAADHDHAEEQANTTAGQQAPAARGDSGADPLVEMTWQSACLPCHGPTGHGDGPNGPMVQAPDLTRDDLQARFSDDDLVGILKNGRNRMPKFDLPDPLAHALVAKVRSLRGH